jgi:hypothetical protein
VEDAFESVLNNVYIVGFLSYGSVRSGVWLQQFWRNVRSSFP